MSTNVRWWLGAPFLALLTIGAAAGCDGQSALVDHLRGCDIIDDGEVGSNVSRLLYAPDDCYQQCLASASCEELEDALCGRSIDAEVRCDQRCAFSCDDGSLVAVELVCDGSEQCPGGEDEAGCPPDACPECDELRCDDGTVYSPWERCDGWARCPDGADERSCPEYQCADGQMVMARDPDIRCNGWAQCRDGSDEAGCAAVVLECTGA